MEKLYHKTLNSVWDGSSLSSWFETISGVKQGCVLSPLLFALFLNDINDFVGGGIKIGNLKINILLYADDIVLIAEDRNVLQSMINKLRRYCDMWNLEINMEKSEIMIMKQGGGRVSRTERWKYGNVDIRIVKKYKYLGIELTPSLNFEQHFKNKVTTVKFAINECWRQFVENKFVDWSSKVNFFNSTFRSMLCYNAEVWGIDYYETIELAQRYFIKRCLGLPKYTPNYALSVECGLKELYQFTLRLHMNYVTRVLFKYPDERFPKIILINVINNNTDLWGKWTDLGRKYDINWLDFTRNEQMWKLHVNLVLKKECDEKLGMEISKARNSENHILFKELVYMNGNGLFKCISDQKIVGLILRARCGVLYLIDQPWRVGSQKLCSMCDLLQNESIEHFLGICSILRGLRLNYLRVLFLDKC